MKKCPRCKLSLVALGASSASRCPGCSGMWVPGSALDTGGRGGVGALLTAFSPRPVDEPPGLAEVIHHLVEEGPEKE